MEQLHLCIERRKESDGMHENHVDTIQLNNS